MEKLKSKSSITESTAGIRVNGHAKGTAAARLEIKKTYKLYIGGKFPRTESGRYYRLEDDNRNIIANICRSSRKDFRDAVVAARKAQDEWARRSAFNKGQVFYRIAETLEGRRPQFVATMVLQGYNEARAVAEINASVDRLLYYAGWSDKYQQVFSSVNPVESSHFNFSYPEPTGVVSVIATEQNALIGLVSAISSAVIGGNAVVVLASSLHPLTAIEFAEVLVASDVPGGIINILTGFSNELHAHFSSHMDVNAVIYCREDPAELKMIRTNASLNVKRVLHHHFSDWMSEEARNPYLIMDTQEIKTTWHPVGI